jgi:hypothetical protein
MSSPFRRSRPLAALAAAAALGAGAATASAAGPAKPSGPGLSEALSTTRGGTLDPLAPRSGGLDTLTGNVLTK